MTLPAQLLDTLAQNGKLVGLAETREEENLTSHRQTNADPEDLPPAERLGDGAADGRADGTADERGEHDEAHGGTALVGLEEVADDGRVEDIGGDGEAGEEAGRDKEGGRAGGGGQGGGGDEEEVGTVEDAAAAVDLGQRGDEERAGGFAQFPYGDEEGAGGGVVVAVVEFGDDAACYRDDGDASEGAGRVRGDAIFRGRI